ncbi:MAG: hypothetical protein IKI37_09155 [Oscillospiraceae bacterium]|nr:hypothetical protein [Oscillospiraceae bacterium]
MSYADGYEASLTLNDVNALTTAQLQSVQDNNAAQENSAVIGKLIDNYQWVLAAVVDNSDKKYKQG